MVYHERYRDVYSSDPASKPGRMESIYSELYGKFEFVRPETASENDLKLVHTKAHIDSIKEYRLIYEIARLAVGGAIYASEITVEGEPAFGLVRPPGHHASPNRCWGFCFFNNIAISVEKLRMEGKIKRALIVDFDLHYGDGTANIFSSKPEISYFHIPGEDREKQLEELSNYLNGKKNYDIIAVSAGFDRHIEDWGGMLHTNDYRTIGALVKEFAEKICDGRRYGVLEGGYNHEVLGKNVRAFLEGME